MLDSIQQHLRNNMHRYNVSTNMFCQKCGTVLDIRKSVSIDLMKDGKELIKSYCFCNKCYSDDMPKRIKSALNIIPSITGHTVEVFHGKNKKLEIIGS